MFVRNLSHSRATSVRISVLVALLAVAFITMFAQQRSAFASGCTFTLSSATYQGAEGSQIPIIVNRSGSCTDPTSVTLNFTDGSATSGIQYQNPSPVNLPFTSGVNSKSWDLQTNDDAVAGNTTLNVALTLTFATGDVLSPTTSAVITIIDNDAASYAFNPSAYAVTEGTPNLTISVVRGGPTTSSATVAVSTVNGTATGGSDFTTITNQTVTFGIGQSTATFNVQIANDGIFEPQESFGIALSSPNPVGALGGNATVTINDNDGAGTVQFTGSQYFVNEADGIAFLSVSRTGGSTGTATVLCSTTGGSATAGSDYTQVTNQVLTWNSGDTANKTCQVPITPDASIEGPETVTVSLSGASGATLGSPSFATLTINDDDGTGGVQFQSATYSANESSGGAILTLVRTNGAIGQVSVDCTTIAGGTATAGLDYTAGSYTATFLNGNTTASCTIPLLDDSSAEGSETVLVQLTNPVGGAIIAGQSTATLTILDSESFGPVINQLTPSVGPTIGGSVLISGSGFLNATSVTFGGFSAPYFVNSDNSITATAPQHSAGTVEVLVYTPSGVNTTNGAQNDYTYTDGPTITSVTPVTGPASGSPATFVTITGTGFIIGGGGMTVSFGSTPTSNFTVNRANSIIVIAPAHAAGLVDIRVTTPGGITPIVVADQFTFTGTSVPVVTNVSPSTGQAGTIVTITGAGFTGVTCPGGITFGGVIADSTNCTIVSDSTITAKVPANAPSGTIDVIVTGPGGSSANTSADNFLNTSNANTLTYTLAFRFTLIGWSGVDGINAAAALKGLESPDNPATNNVFNIVTAIWQFDAASQTYKGYFPGSEGVPGANDFTTLRKGVGYFIAVTTTTNWTIIQG
jgi:hypothetical protein